MVLLKLLDKQEQAKPKASRNNKNTGQNEKKKIQKKSMIQSWFFKKINKIDKSLENLTKKKREKT
jgi:hypothetical protein